MGLTKHDRIAKEIAEKKDVEYHSDRGVDIRTPRQAIEVEVDANKLKEGYANFKVAARLVTSPSPTTS